MLRVPVFTIDNYETIMQAGYHEQTHDHRVRFPDLLSVLQTSFLKQYRNLDSRTLGTNPPSLPSTPAYTINGQQFTHEQVVIRTKLLCPSLRACNYFLRDCGNGSHLGIDIMLPKATPILSFTAGRVTRIKQRDGVSQNEGNCVVVEAPDGYVVAYEHLNAVSVHEGQQLSQRDQVGTCGTTGLSTQYHLHFQVDVPHAPFHPYRTQSIAGVVQHTIDPLGYLFFHTGLSPFIDLPLEPHYQEAIVALYNAGIVSGFQGNVYPNAFLQRYEMALLIDRILTTYNLYSGLPIQHPTYTPYSDIGNNDQELLGALQRLQKYGIMKGHDNKFYPHTHLVGEELLALLGRIFFGLQDANSSPRYAPYHQAFLNKLLITTSRPFLRHAIPRKDVFELLFKTLRYQGLL